FEDKPQVFPVSGVSRQGLQNLLEATNELLGETPEFPLYEDADFAGQDEEAYYGFDEGARDYEISREDDASWTLSGEKLEKLFMMTNLDHDDSVFKFARQLRGMGIDEDLRSRGARDGDIVRIGKFEFEFVD
ncbi:MAG: Obg family GTPase CgtA, partial [Lactococcus sp.]|nr:Obg family GTPase CgtA [Lactococcus sp.]